MMECPKCREKTGVIDTYPYKDILATRRRRICPNGHRFSTIEVVANLRLNTKGNTLVKKTALQIEKSMQLYLRVCDIVTNTQTELTNLELAAEDTDRKLPEPQVTTHKKRSE